MFTKPIKPTNPPTTPITIIIIPLNKSQTPSQGKQPLTITPGTELTKQLPSVRATPMQPSKLLNNSQQPNQCMQAGGRGLPVIHTVTNFWTRNLKTFPNSWAPFNSTDPCGGFINWWVCSYCWVCSALRPTPQGNQERVVW